jgi:hypothetical protein
VSHPRSHENDKKEVIPVNPAFTGQGTGIRYFIMFWTPAFPGMRDCVIIAESAINTVMLAKAGIQNLLKILDSVSRFACTE